ncbi:MULTISPECIES: hypothetical protein [unclassified Bosea (in: a-proteobacteria)]|uniref:hypothetical protein n=1 Tax=unclassified Bosea (in: a-proteobacteria) TaxID=2653178 RepID=UPI000F74EFB5|nr:MULTISPECIES: hypothetical protein [unclassified Bosea (in: a-proteobacteria)]AZO77737.1 hypothetical protein BLM15_08985 [Bosea sp. Tri-49]RXT18351.1 hypothetical protein B5U98_24140 [Bosea sp. Tri-39]RXT32947.1 hypothetical protein B5U99_30485 [Bosea sp. Tri-54]
MNLSAIIAELEGAAQQEAAGIHILETTRFEPELDAIAGAALTAAKRRAEALSSAQSILRLLDASPIAQFLVFFPQHLRLALARRRSRRVVRKALAV